MPNEMIAVCGLDCSACPAHLAWKNDDQAHRERTALEWKQTFGFDFTPAMINCSGCRVAGEPKIGHCSDCKMRRCANSKGHKTCAACDDYSGCLELSGFLGQVPQAKVNLEKLRP